MAKRVRKSYTEAQRQNILATATAEKLTALEVKKRFGVTPVTYYSWRKKKGLKGRRGPRPAALRGASSGDLAAQVRAGVQARMREMIPAIVREEVNGYLASVFGSQGPRRRGRPRKKK